MLDRVKIPPMTDAPTGGTIWGPVIRQAALVLVLFAATGAAAGYLWFRLWDPPMGVVFDGKWFLDEKGLRGEFSSTGWFIVVAAVAGLVLGGLSALIFDRSELMTLAAVAVGAVLATYLMWRLGVHLGPADPEVLAASTPDRQQLPGQIAVAGFSPFLVLPGTALASLALTYVSLPQRRLPPQD